MLKTFSATDIGKKRTMNQDYVYSSETPIGALPNLFIVADGMGGHNGGEYASNYAVEVIVSTIQNSKETHPRHIIEEAIKEANRAVREKACSEPELQGMGTTMVVATVIDEVLQVANVGDSRLYVIGEEIRQITTDHSYVEELVRVGGLDRESARTHPKKNIITRAIGADIDVVADFFTVRLQPGDSVLMCSDGLTNMLDDEEIRMILSGQRDIVEKAEELIKAANNNGGKDNIAVVLIEPFASELD
ncbi:MAG: Stp1/IreP family PP2C-type Ser/Thr phosphatase [Lachnospiraceae bacterium]|nr:Stp1/IreP family PP2C-type Ser/Thr phosphatase [Lachnospiraceae bacterium]